MSRHTKKSRYLNRKEMDTADIIDIKTKKRTPQQRNENHLNIKNISPLTENQRKVFESYDLNKNIVCAGAAGSGKTFLLMYLCLNDILQNNIYNSIKIIRSVVPSRNMGFLPGNETEKNKVYERPYHDICTELFHRGDAYELLKKKDVIEFVSTSFIRGTTWDNSLIIVDEFSNMNFHELDSVITRCGKNSRIFFSGDIYQTDLIFSNNDVSGFVKFLSILNIMKNFEIIEFTSNDNVRSGISREYLIAKEKIYTS